MATPELVLTIEVVSNVQKQIQQTASELQQLVAQLRTAGSQGAPGLNAVKTGLGDVSKSAEDASKSFTQLGTSVRGLQDPLSGAISGFKQLVGAVAGLAVVKFASDLANAAARVQTLGTVLEVVGKNAGFSKQELEDTDKAVQNLGVSSDVSKKSLTTLIQANLGLDKATQLAAAAQDISAAAGRSVTDTYEALANTLQFVNARSLRQLGITVNQADAEQKYAIEIGKSSNELTLQERRLALLNGTLEQAAKLQGSYARALNDVGKQLIELPNKIGDLTEALGANLLPTFLVLVKEFSGFIQTLTSQAQGFNENSSAAENFAKAIEPFVKTFFDLAKFISDNINVLVRFIELLAILKAGDYLTGLITNLQKTTAQLVGATASAETFASALQVVSRVLSGIVIGLALKPIAELTQLFLENRQAARDATRSAEDYKDTLEKLRQLDLSAIGSKLKAGVDVSTLSEREQEQFRSFVTERVALVKKLSESAQKGALGALAEEQVVAGSKITVETGKLSGALANLEKSKGLEKLSADLKKLPDTTENVKNFADALRGLTELKFTNANAELTRIFSLTEQANRIAFNFTGQLEAQRKFVSDSIGLARDKADKLLAIANQEAAKTREAAIKAAPKVEGTQEIADKLKFAQEERKIAEKLAQDRIAAEQGVLTEVRKNLDAATARFIKYKDDVIALVQTIANERIAREQQLEALEAKVLGRTSTFFQAQKLEADIQGKNFDALVAESKGDFEKAKAIRDEQFKLAVQLGNLGELKDTEGKVVATEAEQAAKGLALAKTVQEDLERVERQRLRQAEQKRDTEDQTVKGLEKQLKTQEDTVEQAQQAAITLKVGVSEAQITEVIDDAQKQFDLHEFALKVKAAGGDVSKVVDDLAKDIQREIDAKGDVLRINAEVQADLEKVNAIFAKINENPPTLLVNIKPVVDPALADFAKQGVTPVAAGGAGGGLLDSLINLLGAEPTIAGAARGGVVPGTRASETSDSVLARVTPGEMITRVRAVRYYGEDFFRRLNSMQIPRWAVPAFAFGGLIPGFQDGGVVGTADPAALRVPAYGFAGPGASLTVAPWEESRGPQDPFGGGLVTEANTKPTGLASAEGPFESHRNPVVLDLGILGTYDMLGEDKTIERLKQAISQAATKRRRS